MLLDDLVVAWDYIHIRKFAERSHVFYIPYMEDEVDTRYCPSFLLIMSIVILYTHSYHPEYDCHLANTILSFVSNHSPPLQ